MSTKRILNNYTFKNFIELSREEHMLILSWRNNESIRRWMFNKEPISEQEHFKFIEYLPDNFQIKYWLVNRKSDPIGVISIIDINTESAEWGYYIAPEYHETGLGVEFYYNVLSYLFDFIKLKRIYGFELIDNNGASSLSSLFGFIKEKTIKNVNGINYEVNYRELSSYSWSTKIKNDNQILKLMKFFKNRYK